MISQLGRNRLVIEVEHFMRSLTLGRRARAMAKARAKNERELRETEIRLRLDDVSSIMGLPPNHPVVLAAVMYAGIKALEREEDNVPPSYIGQGWGDQ